MPKKVSVTIFSHHSRSKRLQQTLEALGSDVAVEVVIDYKTEGIWQTAMKAWRSYGTDATHHLVLQDDIIPCKNFLVRLPEIIHHLPNDASVSFCDKLPLMHYAKQKKKSWVLSGKVRHAQALLQPVSQIENFIQWSEWNIRPSYYHDDGRLEMYLHTFNKLMWHTVPSLVSHDDDGSVYRYLKTGDSKPDDKPPYQELYFLGADVDPSTVDWQVENNYVGSASRHKLKSAELWAMGKGEITNPKTQEGYKYLNPRIWTDETLNEPYDVVMERVRREKGLV